MKAGGRGSHCVWLENRAAVIVKQGHESGERRLPHDPTEIAVTVPILRREAVGTVVPHFDELGDGDGRGACRGHAVDSGFSRVENRVGLNR